MVVGNFDSPSSWLMAAKKEGGWKCQSKGTLRQCTMVAR